jgi:hypothetical protein
MISGQKYAGYCPSALGGLSGAKNRRARIYRVRTLNFFKRIMLSQESGEKSAYCFYKYKRGQLPSAQHIIPNRNFLVSHIFSDSLVNAFVAAADKDKLIVTG